MARSLALFALCLALWPPASPAEGPYGLLLTGEEAETFLRTAPVVRRKALGTGITHSDQLTLADGGRTVKAVWKTIDERRHGVTRFEGGGFIVDFADSYKHEIAAYELDKLLHLDLVPPTVERTRDQQTGSVQLWVEGAMTEHDRKTKKLEPPDVERWNEQMYKVRLLHQLTYNTDYRNIRNVLIDPAFRVYAIDNSRAFASYPQLPAENELRRFSRRTLDALKALDRPTVEARMGRWLEGLQVTCLLKRRDRILALAARRVAEEGEAAVLYR
jgi:hypothetical protein